MNIMNNEDFQDFVDAIIRKNKRLLGGSSVEEIREECWAAVMEGIKKWDGSKGKLNSWVYTTVVGRMKDLRKARKKMRIENLLEQTEFSENFSPEDWY